MVSSDRMTTAIRGSRRQSTLPKVLHAHRWDGQTCATGSIPSVLSSMPFPTLSFCKVCFEPGHLSTNHAKLTPDSLSPLDIIRFINMLKLNRERTIRITNRHRYNRIGYFCGRGRGSLSS